MPVCANIALFTSNYPGLQMLGEVPSLKAKTVKVTPHPNSTPS